MNVNIKDPGAAVIVELSGDLDGKTAPLAQEQIVPLLKNGGKLILDMSQVEFMSSAGLRLLLSLQHRVTAKDDLILIGLSKQIKNTMTTTGFLNLFSICETLNEAKATLIKK